MACAERSRLQGEWNQATNEYAKLVKALTSDVGKLLKAEYSKQHEAVEAARAVSEKLRTALDLHLLSHGC